MAFAQKLFAGRLREARRRAGYSQTRVAMIVGVDQSLLSHYEAGRAVPPLPTLVALADLYAVSLDWLTGRSDVPHVIRRRRLVLRRGPGTE